MTVPTLFFFFSASSAAPHPGLLRGQPLLPGADGHFPAGAFRLQLQRPQPVAALRAAQAGALPSAAALQPGLRRAHRHREAAAPSSSSSLLGEDLT